MSEQLTRMTSITVELCFVLPSRTLRQFIDGAAEHRLDESGNEAGSSGMAD
jgi:hypothetical protein